MGWERANFFAPPGESPEIDYSWGKQNWLPWSAAEQRAARSAVAVFDQTSFSKYLVSGPDAEQALQWLCTADVAVPPGTCVYTGLLNDRGTYESDLTVTRLSASEYLLVSSAATTERDKDHMRRQLPRGAQVTITDVTSALRRLRGDGAAVPGAAVRPVPGRPSQRRVPASAPAARSTWATPPSGRPGSPTSASSAGSCTSPRSSRSASTRT